MKRLSVEEKAKRYDEIIEQLKTMMPNWENLSYNGKTFLQDLVHIIPELKESKDDRIRKWLICTLKSLNNSPVQIDGAYEMMLPAIDWLESLRPQNTWKPSDRELGAMLTAIGDERQKGSDVAKELLNIYQQLKKLRGE